MSMMALENGPETYWSKKGSKMMTSSPGSMKPMNALSMPVRPIRSVTSI